MGPRGRVLRCWMLGLSLGGKSGNFRIWLPRSSAHRLFRAVFEWRNGGSSVNCKLSSFWCTQTHAPATRPTLERRAVSYARASIEREISTTSTFAFLQTAWAKESTLERPLCFAKLARAKKASLERDSCFQQVLKNIFQGIFASSFHLRHS